MARQAKYPEKAARERAALRSTPADHGTGPTAILLTLRIRLLLSAAIVYHVSAVFIGAWTGSPPSSPAADAVARPFRTYIAVADLNHGYRFFAPNPGPSHLFRYRLTFADGETQDGYFPNRAEHWPRLLYHRYFMLAENLNVLERSAGPGERTSATPESLQRFRSLADSYAMHLLRSRGGQRIEWEFVRHYQPAPTDVLSGRSLTDEQFYESIQRGSLESASMEQETGQ